MRHILRILIWAQKMKSLTNLHWTETDIYISWAPVLTYFLKIISMNKIILPQRYCIFLKTKWIGNSWLDLISAKGIRLTDFQYWLYRFQFLVGGRWSSWFVKFCLQIIIDILTKLPISEISENLWKQTFRVSFYIRQSGERRCFSIYYIPAFKCFQCPLWISGLQRNTNANVGFMRKQFAYIFVRTN